MLIEGSNGTNDRRSCPCAWIWLHLCIQTRSRMTTNLYTNHKNTYIHPKRVSISHFFHFSFLFSSSLLSSYTTFTNSYTSNSSLSCWEACFNPNFPNIGSLGSVSGWIWPLPANSSACDREGSIAGLLSPKALALGANHDAPALNNLSVLKLVYCTEETHPTPPPTMVGIIANSEGLFIPLA